MPLDLISLEALILFLVIYYNSEYNISNGKGINDNSTIGLINLLNLKEDIIMTTTISLKKNNAFDFSWLAPTICRLTESFGKGSIFSNWSKYQTSNVELEEIKKLIGDPDISISLKSEISYFCRSKIAEFSLYTMARRSEKFVRYAMYYMTDRNAKKIKMNKEDREFVNTISFYAGYGKIYEYDRINDITQYDIESASGVFTAPHCILLSEIRSRLNAESFVNKWKSKLASETILNINERIPLETTNKSYTDTDGFIHPFFKIVNGGASSIVFPKKPEYMDSDTFKLFDTDLSKILDGKEYYYSKKDDGAWYLNIKEGYSEKSFLLDDGSIMGPRKAYILGRIMLDNGYTDTLFVDINSNLATTLKIIDNPFYCLTIDEINEAKKNMFKNQAIYHYIDFSNSGYIFDSFTNVDKGAEMFERYIGGVIEVLKKSNIPSVRLRITDYKSPVCFTLVSDDKCNHTLLDCSQTIIKDLKLFVTSKSIIIKNGETSTEFKVNSK